MNKDEDKYIVEYEKQFNYIDTDIISELRNNYIEGVEKELIKDIIDIYNKKYANYKDYRNYIFDKKIAFGNFSLVLKKELFNYIIGLK